MVDKTDLEGNNDFHLDLTGIKKYKEEDKDQNYEFDKKSKDYVVVAPKNKYQ